MDNLELEELSFSDEALSTRVYFYQGLNEFNIFVEDKEKEYIYETIFQRLFENKYKIKTILGLGGKPNVIQHFKKFGNKTDNVKNIYIVDGDFDRYIYADKMIQDPCFIYLKTYNIENYFLDENACIQFVKGRLGIFDQEVKKKLNFQYWKDKIINEASKLFLCYCFIKKFYPTRESVSRSPYLFIDSKTGFKRTDGMFEQYWDSIIELDSDAIEKIAEIDMLYKEINGENYFNLICGKFLFDSLCCYIRMIIKSKINKNDFMFHLVNHFDISQLNFLKEAILLNLQ